MRTSFAPTENSNFNLKHLAPTVEQLTCVTSNKHFEHESDDVLIKDEEVQCAIYLLAVHHNHYFNTRLFFVKLHFKRVE